MNERIDIREIVESDAKLICELSLELGYAIDAVNIQKQISTIIRNTDHVAYVALLGDNIIGYVHGFFTTRLTTTPFFEICGLVVTEAKRGKGIGGKLILHLEKNLNDCDEIRVRCNSKRLSAHRFYTRLDYLEKKEQKVFQRELHKIG